ncbi:MAG: cation transporter [Bacteroidota bacterium]
MPTVTSDIHIEGMSCRHCVAAVEGALAQLDGLQVETVGIGEARVRYEAQRVSAGSITEALADEGYAVRSVERVA